MWKLGILNALFNEIFQQDFSNIESVDSVSHESNFAWKPCTVYLFRFKITICIVFNDGMRSVVLGICSNLDDETELGNRAFKECEETVERSS